MDPSLLEQFLGPSATQFQLPSLIEDENDELHPLVSTGFQRLSHTRKSLPGKNYIPIIRSNLFTHTYLLTYCVCIFASISSSLTLFIKSVPHSNKKFIAMTKMIPFRTMNHVIND